jgi:type II secretory pathway component PulL
MSQPQWTLFESATQWQIAALRDGDFGLHSVELADDALPCDVATAVAATLRSLGYLGEPVVLAIDGRRCLAARFPLPESGAKNRQTMLYQFESWLPLAAEDLVCDFVTCDGQALGVAVEAQPLKSLIDALEDGGVAVQAIVPTALLALGHHLAETDRADSYSVLWSNGEAIDVFRVCNGTPVAWRVCQEQARALTVALEVDALSSPTAIAVVGYDLPSPVMDAIATLPDVVIETIQPTTLIEAASRFAAQLLLGQREPLIDLRRDAISPADPYRPVRGWLRTATASCAALLLLASGSMLYRAVRHEQLAEQCLEEQANAFRDALPGRALPAGVRSRLESERAKLAALHGGSSPSREQASALPMLYELLAAMPEGLRCRVFELRLERGRIQMEGELRNHGDADAIAQGLRGRQFRVESPKTQQLSGSAVGVRMMAVADKGDVRR